MCYDLGTQSMYSSIILLLSTVLFHFHNTHIHMTFKTCFKSYHTTGYYYDFLVRLCLKCIKKKSSSRWLVNSLPVIISHMFLGVLL